MSDPSIGEDFVLVPKLQSEKVINRNVLIKVFEDFFATVIIEQSEL